MRAIADLTIPAAPTCRCGAEATVRLIVTLRSTRGVGTRIERPQCSRCADKTAFAELANGATKVGGRPI